MSERPYEIIAQPFTVYVAPLGTAFPKVDADPAAAWVTLGVSGDLNISEDGVTIQHSQSVEGVRVLGSTGPRKAFRTEEETRVSFTLLDLTLEAYAHLMNDNPITTTPPTPTVGGYKSMGLSHGLAVPQVALLVRGVDASSYGDGWNAQYEFPVAVQVAEAEVVFTKGEPAGLAYEYLILEDPDATSAAERCGRKVVQNADVTT